MLSLALTAALGAFAPPLPGSTRVDPETRLPVHIPYWKRSRADKLAALDYRRRVHIGTLVIGGGGLGIGSAMLMLVEPPCPHVCVNADRYFHAGVIMGLASGVTIVGASFALLTNHLRRRYHLRADVRERWQLTGSGVRMSF